MNQNEQDNIESSINEPISSKENLTSEKNLTSKENLTNQSTLPVYKNLIIGGGGFYCFQFFGIIKYLDDNNLLKDINKYIGVSAGALINLLLLIGYKFCEIENFLMKFDFSKIFDLQFEKIFVENNFKGLSNGDNFTKLIKKFLIKKDFNENITLDELYKKTNKDFIIGVTNITEDKVEYLNHVNYPDMPIYLALRMTSCLPVIFDPIIYKENYYIDGGLKDNFPIQLIPEEELKYTAGIVLYPFKEKYDIKNMITIKYLFHLYRTISSSYLKDKIDKYKDCCKLFIVTTSNENFINYKINENNRKELFDLGYEQCRLELNN